MAVVVYKCDTCKREVELQRKIDGLEHVGRCNITLGCRGSLYQVNLYPDYLRGSLPDPVVGLDDWRQRKVIHNHAQAVERDRWRIYHSMGVVPVVSVYGDRPVEGDLDNRVEVTPTDINVIDDDTLELVFDRPWSGIAQLVARESDPDLFNPIAEQVETVVVDQQISLGRELTIATETTSVGTNPFVTMQMEFTSPVGPVATVSYVVDNQPTAVQTDDDGTPISGSAWTGINTGRVIIKGKIYEIRSFNIFDTALDTSIMGAGTTFRFTGIDPAGGAGIREIEEGEVLILMASEPYNTIDRIYDQIIDVTKVTAEQNTFSFYYTTELFAKDDVIKEIYPPIREIAV